MTTVPLNDHWASLIQQAVRAYHEAGHCVSAHVVGLTIVTAHVEATDGFGGGVMIAELQGVRSEDDAAWNGFLASDQRGIRFVDACAIFVRSGFAASWLAKDMFNKVPVSIDWEQCLTASSQSDQAILSDIIRYSSYSIPDLYSEAEIIVSSNRVQIGSLAGRLLRDNRLDGPDIHQQLSETGCVRGIRFG